MLGAEKGAGQVGVDALAPAGGGEFCDRRHLAQGAGVVHRDVEAAEAVPRGVDQSLGERFVAHVAGDCHGLAAGSFYLLDQLVESRPAARGDDHVGAFFGKELRSEEHTSELQSLMRISYAVFCLKKKTTLNSR